MASNDTSPPSKKRTESEDDSDNEFNDIEALCEKVVELFQNEKMQRVEEARRAATEQTSPASEGGTEPERAQRAGFGETSSSDQRETGSGSDYKDQLKRLIRDLHHHRQRAARHGRVDRLEKLVELLASLPEGVKDSISSTKGGEGLFELFDILAEAAVNGCVGPITFLCPDPQFKESKIKHAARFAFLFQRTDVIQAFAQLGVEMNEDVFLADVLALKNTPVTGPIPFGTPSSCTAAQETRSYFTILKAALRGDQTQVVQCLDKARSAGVQLASSPSENEDENVDWMECHGRVFCNDNWAPTKKDAVINIAILITIARGYHQALRVLLDQAGPAWRDVTMLREPVSIAQFHSTPMTLAVLSGCVHTVQVLLDQVQQVQGQSLSALPGFLFNAMMHERLDIVLYLVKKAKAVVNGAGDAYRDFHCLLIEAIRYALFNAIERRSRSVVKLIFEEFKRDELQLSDSHSEFFDQLVQDSKSLPILRTFLAWCPDYVKKELQIKSSLDEVWPQGYKCLLEAKGKA